MENKVLYNLDKIISVYVYKKKVNRWFEDFKPKGYYWWKIFGVIPLFKYHLKENTFNYVSDRVTEDEVIELTDNHCYIENEIVYYNPTSIYILLEMIPQVISALRLRNSLRILMI